MKKLGALIFLVLCGFTTKAQRFAYVDTDYILNQMPEYKSAQKQIDVLALEWQRDVERKKAEIAKLRTDYEAEKIFLVEEIRRQRESDIANKEKELAAFQTEKFGYEGELFKKRQELIKPIQDRVFDAIQKVAKNNALDFIFDKAGGVTMLVANAKYDVSDEVLEEMGIVPSGPGGPKKEGEEEELPQDGPPK